MVVANPAVGRMTRTAGHFFVAKLILLQLQQRRYA
jgi:hypothetical protein